MVGSTVRALLCPACAMGQGEAGSDGVVLIAALLLLPLCAAAAAGFIIVRLLVNRRSRLEAGGPPGPRDQDRAAAPRPD